MDIQTLESQKIDFINAMKDRDKHITQMQAENRQLMQEKQHLQQTQEKLKTSFVDAFSEVETLNERIHLLEKQHK